MNLVNYKFILQENTGSPQEIRLRTVPFQTSIQRLFSTTLTSEKTSTIQVPKQVQRNN